MFPPLYPHYKRFLTRLHRPDPLMFDPQSLVAPYNSFAMTFREFVPHITKVLESLGLTLQTRTNFIKCVSVFITGLIPFLCAAC